MSVYTYNWPIVYDFKSNDSYTGKRNILARECEEFVSPEFENLWNYNLCSQDQCYCQPFVKGDRIPFQYQIKDPNVFQVAVALKRASDDQIFYGSEGFITEQMGTDSKQNRYYNFVIDTSKFSEECFYAEIMLIYTDIDVGDYETCYESKIEEDLTTTQARYECLLQYSTLDFPPKYVASEPFCIEKCSKTILIAGSYYDFFTGGNDYDCDGKYYGLINGQQSLFYPYVRIHGEVEQRSFSFTKTNINKKIKASTQVTSYLLRSHKKIPMYVVRQIASCFNSKRLVIDFVLYTGVTELSKNVDEGNMWVISATITNECEEINFTCL